MKHFLCFLILLYAVSAFPQYDVTVSEITVWLHVLGKDQKPVEDLTRDEIEIYEDGKRQNLTCFEKTSTALSTSAGPLAESPTTPVKMPKRRIVLFIDLLNMSPSEYLRVRPQIEQFLNQIGGRNWAVMLAALTEKGKLGVIAPFTSDLKIIRSLLLKAPANGKRDATEKTNIRNIAFLLDRAKKDPAMQENYIQKATALATVYARDEERNGELSVYALESFAGYLFRQHSSGEHTIILYVSGGFHADPGRRYHEMIAAYQEKEHGLSSLGSLRDTSFDIRRLVKKSVGKLNKMNTTLYTINTRGMYDGSDTLEAADPSLSRFGNTFLLDYQESLAQIADETGGLFFKNSQNFKKGFDLVLNDLNVTYEICYRTPGHKEKGKYHEIKVKVNRKNVNVRHRRGYVD